MKLSAGDCDVHFYTQLVILFDLLLFFFLRCLLGTLFTGVIIMVKSDGVRILKGYPRYCSFLAWR